MTKFPCGKCGIGAKTKAVLCKGACQTWYLVKCVQMSNIDYNKLYKGEISTWICSHCQSEDESVSVAEEMEKLQEKIYNLSANEDLETSLTLAAEAGNILLSENEKLKQKLHDLQNKKSKRELELEDKIMELEVNVLNASQINENSEKKFVAQMRIFQEKSKIEHRQKDELICHLESEKSNDVSQINQLTKDKLVLENKIKLIQKKLDEYVLRSNAFYTNNNDSIEPNKPQNLIKKSISKQDNASQTQNQSSFSLELLGNEWLKDDIIKRYLDIVNYSVKELEISTICINPVISHAIRCFPDMEFTISSLNLQEVNYVFIPVNDAAPSKTVAGSHWSLLFYQRSVNTFYHFDSMGQYNIKAAKEIISKFTTLKIFENAKFENIQCPQQHNTFDCGIYLCLFVDWLFRGIIANKVSYFIANCSRFMRISESDIVSKRSCLAYLCYRDQHLQFNPSTIQKLLLGTINESKCPDVNDNKTGQNHRDGDGQWRTVGKSNIHRNSANNKSLTKFAIPTSNQYDILDKIYNKKDSVSNDDPINATNGSSKAKDMQKGSVSNESLHKKRNKSLEKRIKIELFADSQGRELPEIIGSCSKGLVYVNGLITSGATVGQVYSNAKKSHSDPLVLIAGSNDVVKKSFKSIYETMERDLQILSEARPVIITTIPPRYDIQKTDPIQDEIALANNYIKEIAVRMKTVQLIDLDDLKKIHFSRQGLHLNLRGKRKLAFMIIQHLTNIKTKVNTRREIFKINSMADFPPLVPPKGAATCTSPSVQKSHEVGEHLKPIHVNELKMEDVIQSYRYNKEVAFAHCISADLNNIRSLSAGVATVFKDQFGKPAPSDCVSDHLSIQRIENGATVYGLITKPQYYTKPNLTDYNLAFEELTQDFKKRGLKKLICSPMGCVRDRISIEHFAANVMKFQQATGSHIQIITYNENSNHNLRNGLSHADFLKELRHIIGIHQASFDRQRETNQTSDLTLDDSSTLEERNDIPHAGPVQLTTSSILSDSGESLDRSSDISVHFEEELSSL
ncbi:hypothetical protein J6590_014298 [Homalodisca vitripennis]|nr:hypothetical protein J6590_014298 [Homalodisca vitripennis]